MDLARTGMAAVLCVCVSEAIRLPEFFSRSDGISRTREKTAINSMQLAGKACSKYRLYLLLIEAAQCETGPETVDHDMITCDNARHRAAFCNVSLRHDHEA